MCKWSIFQRIRILKTKIHWGKQEPFYILKSGSSINLKLSALSPFNKKRFIDVCKNCFWSFKWVTWMKWRPHQTTFFVRENTRFMCHRRLKIHMWNSIRFMHATQDSRGGFIPPKTASDMRGKLPEELIWSPGATLRRNILLDLVI